MARSSGVAPRGGLIRPLVALAQSIRRRAAWRAEVDAKLERILEAQRSLLAGATGEVTTSVLPDAPPRPRLRALLVLCFLVAIALGGPIGSIRADSAKAELLHQASVLRGGSSTMVMMATAQAEAGDVDGLLESYEESRKLDEAASESEAIVFHRRSDGLMMGAISSAFLGGVLGWLLSVGYDRERRLAGVRAQRRDRA